MTRKNLEPYYQKVKEMYESGASVRKIREELCLGSTNVYRIISILGIERRKPTKKEPEQNQAYVKKRVKLEKVIIGGKRYTDITPLFAGR